MNGSWESRCGREEEIKESDKVSGQSSKFWSKNTITEAKELISGGNPIETRKLKVLRTSLQVLDRDIVELVEDASKIDSGVSESCELVSVIIIHWCHQLDFDWL